MAYKELQTAFELDHVEGNVTGSRTFITDPNGNVTLPTVGTSEMVASPANTAGTAGAAITGCICRRLRGPKYDANGIAYYQASYSSQTQSASGGTSVDQDADSRSYELTTEEVFLYPNEPGSGSATPDQSAKLVLGDWYWNAANSEKMDQALARPIGIQRFTRSVIGLTDAQNTTFKTRLKTHHNTINAAAFEGWAIGQVKFDGATDGGTHPDETGATVHSYALQFSAKILKPLDAAITQDDWLYMLNPRTNTWVKPENGAGDNLFSKTDFSTSGLFAPY